MDVVTLMQRVCRVDHLREEAARRMAEALFASHPEFRRLPSGHWALSADGAGGAICTDGTLASKAGRSGEETDPSSVERRSLMDVAFAVVDGKLKMTRTEDAA